MAAKAASMPADKRVVLAEDIRILCGRLDTLARAGKQYRLR
jgi:hypothetical protein